MRRKITKEMIAKAFVDYQFNGKTQLEIADNLGVSSSTISYNLKYFAMDAAVKENINRNLDIPTPHTELANAFHLTVPQFDMLVILGRNKMGLNPIL